MSEEIDDPRGSDWTQAEIDLIVAAYFDMFALHRAGIPFVKKRRHEALQSRIRRSEKSIEWKLRNVSAVLEKLGMSPVSGYAPAANHQIALIEAIERALIEKGGPEILVDGAIPAPELALPLKMTPSPKPNGGEAREPEALKRLVRKFDPAARDARNRALGKQGEEKVLHFERERLLQSDRPDLAKAVRWVSEVDGDGAGYDILSFAADGSERLLEVKTTNGAERTPFYISENERLLSVERPEAFRLVRLYDFFVAPKAFRLRPPLEDVVMLKAASYKVSLL